MNCGNLKKKKKKKINDFVEIKEKKNIFNNKTIIKYIKKIIIIFLTSSYLLSFLAIFNII